MSKLFDLIEKIGKASDDAKYAIRYAESCMFSMDEDVPEDPNEIPLTVMIRTMRTVMKSVGIARECYLEVEAVIQLDAYSINHHIFSIKKLSPQEVDYAKDVRDEILVFGKIINDKHQRLKRMLQLRKKQ